MPLPVPGADSLTLLLFATTHVKVLINMRWLETRPRMVETGRSNPAPIFDWPTRWQGRPAAANAAHRSRYSEKKTMYLFRTHQILQLYIFGIFEPTLR